MTARKNAAAKAVRYLAEGRLIDGHAARSRITATCRGDAQVYTGAWSASRGRSCTCPAKTRCSHLLALGRVVALGHPHRPCLVRSPR